MVKIIDFMSEPKSKRFYTGATAFFLSSVISSAVGAGSNLWDLHLFDKYVTKHIEIAANVSSAGKSSGSLLSMESSLEEAKKSVHVSSLENPAIIWKTPATDVKYLEDLLTKSITRSQQVEAFKYSFDTGVVPENAPLWVSEAHARLTSADTSLTKALARSEFGQRIAVEYEALNSVIGGGTRISAKNLQEEHRSLIDTLDTAGGWRSMIRFQADDYKTVHALIFIGYLKANMGYLAESLTHFKQAKSVMDSYPDDKNLAIFRNTPELSQRTIKGLINSSIHELDALAKDHDKYSTGWWQRLRFFNQSIGGQANPSIQDLAENISDRYLTRFNCWSGLALIGLYLTGRYAKKLKLVKQYEVEGEKSA